MSGQHNPFAAQEVRWLESSALDNLLGDHLVYVVYSDGSTIHLLKLAQEKILVAASMVSPTYYHVTVLVAK